MPDVGSVSVDHCDGVVRVSFHHPKANSLPGGLLDELADSFRQISASPGARVILLESKGKAFCAGASFEEFERLSNLQEAEEFFSRFATLFLAMKECPQWVIAKVQGKAVGGGVGLIAGADYALGSTEVAVKLSEYALDIGPYVIGPVVERKIGSAAFASMALDCQWRSAEWCLERGLLDVMCESNESLEQSSVELLETLSGRSVGATRELKKMAWEQTVHWKELLYSRAKISAELLMARK